MRPSRVASPLLSRPARETLRGGRAEPHVCDSPVRGEQGCAPPPKQRQSGRLCPAAAAARRGTGDRGSPLCWHRAATQSSEARSATPAPPPPRISLPPLAWALGRKAPPRAGALRRARVRPSPPGSGLQPAGPSDTPPQTCAAPAPPRPRPRRPLPRGAPSSAPATRGDPPLQLAAGRARCSKRPRLGGCGGVTRSEPGRLAGWGWGWWGRVGGESGWEGGENLLKLARAGEFRESICPVDPSGPTAALSPRRAPGAGRTRGCPHSRHLRARAPPAPDAPRAGRRPPLWSATRV